MILHTQLKFPFVSRYIFIYLPIFMPSSLRDEKTSLTYFCSRTRIYHKFLLFKCSWSQQNCIGFFLQHSKHCKKEWYDLRFLSRWEWKMDFSLIFVHFVFLTLYVLLTWWLALHISTYVLLFHIYFDLFSQIWDRGHASWCQTGGSREHRRGSILLT